MCTKTAYTSLKQASTQMRRIKLRAKCRCPRRAYYCEEYHSFHLTHQRNKTGHHKQEKPMQEPAPKSREEIAAIRERLAAHFIMIGLDSKMAQEILEAHDAYYANSIAIQSVRL